MITQINHADVKKDMLKSSSNVQEVLRALYLYGLDYIMARIGGRERLIHKEQLVSLLELGKASATIDELMSASLNEPMSARMQLEDIPRDALLLLFDKKSGKSGELSRMTFEEYRESGIKEQQAATPDWWGAPLPLLCMDEGRVLLNERGAKLIPCDVSVFTKQTERMVRDRILTVKEKKREKTFSLQPLDEKIFLIEDISGDFEMAEELVWWAAAGKAFFRRLEENGAVIRKLSPFDKVPDGAAEVISCSWEGELVGRLVIGITNDAEPLAADDVTAAGGEGSSEAFSPSDAPPGEAFEPAAADAPAEPEKIAEAVTKENDPPEQEPAKPGMTESDPAAGKEAAVKEKKARAKKNAAKTSKPTAKRKSVSAETVNEKNGGLLEEGGPGPSVSEWNPPRLSELEEEALKDVPLKTESENADMIEDPFGTLGDNLARLNKNAARKAYGGARGLTPGDERKIKG